MVRPLDQGVNVDLRLSRLVEDVLLAILILQFGTFRSTLLARLVTWVLYPLLAPAVRHRERAEGVPPVLGWTRTRASSFHPFIRRSR